MAVSTPAAGRANGLSTVVNVITAPREAFETLRTSPMWGWAFLVAGVLTMAGQYLATPAAIHAVQASWPQQVAADPRLAGLSPEQQQNALNVSLSVIRYVWLALPVFVLIGTLLQTVVMLVFGVIGKGKATFKQLWCASMNVSVIGFGVYSIVAGLVAVVRGADSYNSGIDAFTSIPSPAWLAPHAAPKLVAILAAFNVVSLWGAVVLALAMIYVAKVSKLNAAACALTVTVLAALYFSINAK